jgi:hypothetical protein
MDEIWTVFDHTLRVTSVMKFTKLYNLLCKYIRYRSLLVASYYMRLHVIVLPQ